MLRVEEEERNEGSAYLISDQVSLSLKTEDGSVSDDRLVQDL